LQEKIQPKIKAVGIRLLIIYLLLTFAEIILLMAGKMNLFESVCHSFGTIATGGFSPKNTSLIAYSPYIQYVITVFMFLAGNNFVIHYYLFKREFKKVKANEELKFYFQIVFTIVAIVTASLYFTMQKPLEESFRESAFQVVSIITCTGFASADYLQWPPFAWTIIFFSMFLGGSTGSTAGGIKMARHLILLNTGRTVGHRPEILGVGRIFSGRAPLAGASNGEYTGIGFTPAGTRLAGCG
jgi:trk system potassium uptake protein TrkH